MKLSTTAEFTHVEEFNAVPHFKTVNFTYLKAFDVLFPYKGKVKPRGGQSHCVKFNEVYEEVICSFTPYH